MIKAAFRALILALPIAFSSFTYLLINETQVDALTTPACRSANITVTAGIPSPGAAQFPSGTMLTQVFFTNHGPACHLVMGGPIVVATRGVVHGRITATSELSVPGVPASEQRHPLAKGARGEALVEVRGLPASMLRTRACDSKAATGFFIEAFALPTGARRFFTRSLHNVCFHSGSGTNAIDLGVVWVGSN